MQVPQNWKSANFRQALAEKRFVQAETWLRYVREHREDEEFSRLRQTWDQWIGDREHDLFEALYLHAKATGATAFFGHAKPIVEWSFHERHKAPRAAQLAKVAGIAYELIPELPFTG